MALPSSFISFFVFFVNVILLLQDYVSQKEMSKPLVNSPEPGATGPLESQAGMIRNSPETEQQPHNLPSQIPSQLAKVATALSNGNKTLPPDEAKTNDAERPRVGVCQLAPVQANATFGQDSIEPSPLINAPSAAAGNTIASCKIPPLQNPDGETNPSLGKSTLEQNNAKGGWVSMSQSTVVLGTDGNTSVLPGNVTEVSRLPCHALLLALICHKCSEKRDMMILTTRKSISNPSFEY